MEIQQIINKKLKKLELSNDELQFVIDGFLSKKISREEMADFLKAVYDNDMTEKETIALTKIMQHSGKTINLRSKTKLFADKHSTGGVSDSTTLIIAPIVACLGVNFLKMSGRKLGHTGGTVDKLKCFEGYNSELSPEQAEKLVSKNGAIIIGQSDELAPADKYIYKLRDETNTIMSIPLAASSIMSKKLASGTDVIVLDVKCGNGAFMKNKEMATRLAKLMVKIGKSAGKKTSAVITDMNQPLGQNVGSLMEVLEAIEILKGKQGDLSTVSVFLASKIVELARDVPFKYAQMQVTDILNSGRALDKLKTIIKNQNGSLDLFDSEIAGKIIGKPTIINSSKAGFVTKFDLEKLGNLVRDYCNNGGKGIKVLKRLNDKVDINTPLIEVYGNPTKKDFASCIEISSQPTTKNELIYQIIN